MCDGRPRDADDLFRDLCRSLAANSDVAATSALFAALQTNSDRLDFALNLLEERGIRPEYVSGGKDDAKSAAWRQAGNEKFKAKKCGEAMELYTKSVAYAVIGGSNLALAYANRSAVLFEQKLYMECLKDIERAFQNNYPEDLKPKLEQRRLKATNLAKQQREFSRWEPLPNMSSPENNSTISCASNSVKIDFEESMGRHVVAAKSVEVGEVVAIERPFGKILLKDRALDHCHNCLKSCHNLIPCHDCANALFCDDDCLEEANRFYHRYECAILGSLYTMNSNKLSLLALRVAIIAKDDYAKLKVRSREDGGVYQSERYEEIHALLPNTEKRSTRDLFERAATMAIIFKLVKEHSDFTSDYDEGVFKELLLLHYQTGPSNFHEISELVVDPLGSSEIEEIGAGAYAFLSLLNHSCSPNVVRHCYGSTIVLRALRPIGEGQQCFDNYGYHHALMAKAERRKHLLEQYHFECSCEACLNDWPLYQDLRPAVDCGDVECHEDELTALRRGDLETAKKTISKMYKRAAMLERFAPCRNLADVQEIMKQCLAIFANKRTKFAN